MEACFSSQIREPSAGWARETALCQQWRAGRVPKPFVTDTGFALTLVYPGRQSFDRGPDFRDAILATQEGELLFGDVEVHLRSTDWHAHGHHADPHYDGVILHVVGRHNASATLSSAGARIPTLTLEADEEQGGQHEATEAPFLLFPCRTALEARGPAVFHQALASAGEERLAAKAAQFESLLSCQDPAQTLYEAFMEALGYSQNRAPFRELARRAPLVALEAATNSKPNDERLAILEAWLFGAAGLLPSQQPRLSSLAPDALEVVATLEERWQQISADWDIAPLSPGQWQLSRVRPGNAPPRRVAAATRLLARALPQGLISGLIQEPLASPRPLRSLRTSFRVRGEGFWRWHTDFSSPCISRASDLIGSGRTDDIVVNCALPFAIAYGHWVGDQELSETAWACLRSFRRLPSNELTRHLASELGATSERSVAPSAVQQQGLLHIYWTRHRQLRCGECPLATLA